MIPTVDLERRYSPGEDPTPLVRSVLGGLLGGAAALLLDRVVGGAGPEGWLWPAALADVLWGDPTDVAAGAAAALVLAASCGVLFAYGQVRRFVPGPSWLAGLASGLAAWIVAAPALVPHAAAWIATDSAVAAVGQSAAAVAESLAGALLCGVIVGLTNPTRYR